MTKGAEKATFCIKKPATDEPTAQKTLRARFAMPLANVRSFGSTTAATYDWRVGTSISTSASRQRNNTIATFNEGANAAATKLIILNNRFERTAHSAMIQFHFWKPWCVE